MPKIRSIKRKSDSTVIYVEQPGDVRCPVVGTGDKVLVRAEGGVLDGLFCNPYIGMRMIADGKAEPWEEQ